MEFLNQSIIEIEGKKEGEGGWFQSFLVTEVLGKGVLKGKKGGGLMMEHE